MVGEGQGWSSNGGYDYGIPDGSTELIAGYQGEWITLQIPIKKPLNIV